MTEPTLDERIEKLRQQHDTFIPCPYGADALAIIDELRADVQRLRDEYVILAGHRDGWIKKSDEQAERLAQLEKERDNLLAKLEGDMSIREEDFQRQHADIWLPLLAACRRVRSDLMTSAVKAEAFDDAIAKARSEVG